MYFFLQNYGNLRGKGGLLFAANFGQNKEMFWARKYFIVLGKKIFNIDNTKTAITYPFP